MPALKIDAARSIAGIECRWTLCISLLAPVHTDGPTWEDGWACASPAWKGNRSAASRQQLAGKSPNPAGNGFERSAEARSHVPKLKKARHAHNFKAVRDIDVGCFHEVIDCRGVWNPFGAPVTLTQ